MLHILHGEGTSWSALAAIECLQTGRPGSEHDNDARHEVVLIGGSEGRIRRAGVRVASRRPGPRRFRSLCMERERDQPATIYKPIFNQQSQAAAVIAWDDDAAAWCSRQGVFSIRPPRPIPIDTERLHPELSSSGRAIRREHQAVRTKAPYLGAVTPGQDASLTASTDAHAGLLVRSNPEAARSSDQSGPATTLAWLAPGGSQESSTDLALIATAVSLAGFPIRVVIADGPAPAERLIRAMRATGAPAAIIQTSEAVWNILTGCDIAVMAPGTDETKPVACDLVRWCASAGTPILCHHHPSDSPTRGARCDQRRARFELARQLIHRLSEQRNPSSAPGSPSVLTRPGADTLLDPVRTDEETFKTWLRALVERASHVHS